MFEIAFTQHRGKVCREQQDALWNGVRCVQHPNAACAALMVAEPALVAVADGVAISPAPHLASRFVIKNLAALAKQRELSVATVREVHGALCDRYARGQTCGTSTTLVAAWLTDDEGLVVNVGDSRAYLISEGGAWRQLSRDHTFLNELLEAKAADRGTAYASIYDALSDCLIADHEETQFAIHQARYALQPGHRLLLCSDGLHDTLGDERVHALYDDALSSLQQVEVWRNAVLHAGAPDNFSIILAQAIRSPDA